MVASFPLEPGLAAAVGSKNAPRLLLAKIGLDGHDRGVKVLARSFRDAGIEVIYTGLWQTCESTVYAAMQEDVDIIGVSLLSAAHLTVMPELLRLRKQVGIDHIPIILGGIVPVGDHPQLLDSGVAAVFNPGSSISSIVEKVRSLAAAHPPIDVRQAEIDYAKGDCRALSRLITCLQRGMDFAGWSAPKGHAKVVGITGAPGVGKSSFIGAVGKTLRKQGQRVAVLAIDPSSPVTGGALLGDRLRMMAGHPDEHFFVRSLSSGEGGGSLSPHCSAVITLLDGFGFDFILVETVGAGQADVAIRDLVGEVALVLMPDTGDAIQFSKAGIMEVATCFVINKCDLQGADATEGQLRGVIGETRPILRVSSIRSQGFDAVADWLSSLA